MTTRTAPQSIATTTPVIIQGTLYSDTSGDFATLTTKPFDFTSSDPQITLEVLGSGTFDAAIPDGRYDGALFIAPAVNQHDMEVLGWLSEQAITCAAVIEVRNNRAVEIIDFVINVGSIKVNMETWSTDAEQARSMSLAGQVDLAIEMWQNHHGDLQ